MKSQLAHYCACWLYNELNRELPEPGQLIRLVSRAPGTPPVFKAALEGFAAAGDQGSAIAAIRAFQTTGMDPGRYYQDLKDRGQKKRTGQVFTPPDAVQKALELLPAIMPRRIIDPACGAGDFMLAAVRQWPQAQCTGLDIDPLALAVAECRLIALGGKPELFQTNALDWQGEYELVLGNPPWGSRLSSAPVQGTLFPSPRGQNSFVYFLELAHKLLIPGGQLCFIVPEAFAKVRTYSRVRAWFVEQFQIGSLIYMPNLFRGYYAPALAIIARKKTGDGGGETKIPVWARLGNGDFFSYNTISPRACTRERFNINWRQDFEGLWEHCCQGAVFLIEGELDKPVAGEAVVDFSLGIVTGNNRRHISLQPQPGQLPVLMAADVSREGVASPNHWLDYNPSELQQVAPLAKYQVPSKLVYRFVSREIIVAVDTTGSLTLNNLNLIIPLKLPFSPQYLAALLNSRLLNTLYMYRFFTGKVLTGNLRQLPLQPGTPAQQEQIEAAIGNEREQLVYQLYGLDGRQQQLVEAVFTRLKSTFFV